MPRSIAQHLTHQLLPTVSSQLAAQLQSFEWSTAEVVERGKDHSVVISPGLAVARIPRSADAQLTRLSQLVQQLVLPWRVPTSLSQVSGGVLQAYIPGTAHPHGSGNPKILAQIVDVFGAYDVAELPLNVPFAQRGRFTEQMLKALDSVVANGVARDIAEHVHGWTDDEVGAGLVHGDLAGHNMHWRDGELVGILDWDYAARWDTALNATYLSLWHGVAPEEFSETPNRARVWSGALGLYSLADALTWDISPGGWRRLNAKVQPRIERAKIALTAAEG